MGVKINFEEIKELAREYYSRRDIQKILVSFSNGREVIPRYTDNFGKRPDVINYNNDIIALIKKGVTSFHSSEEIWNDPLQLSTEMNAEKMNELRKGWDLILDIDCKSWEYSKIAAELLVEALKFHGISNIGIKYSGNKGFHLGISFDAFPEKARDIKIKDFFPEGPRIIAGYLSDLIKKHLAERMLEKKTISELAKEYNKEEEDITEKICIDCEKEAIEKKEIIKKCDKCGIEVGNPREDVCPNCNEGKLFFLKIEMIIYCPTCGEVYNKKEEELFENGKFNPYSILDIDTVLISPRHLFRMPYSLHEKTGLASIVLTPNQLKSFDISWAKPQRVIPKQFLPKPEKDEAKKLFVRALDWDEGHKSEDIRNKDIMKKISKKDVFTYNAEQNNNQKFEFKDINPEFYPSCIKKIMGGMKEDGRKRALFVLINFLRSINLDISEIEKRIEDWNKLNYKPLKKGYIITQLDWFKKHKVMLPPNCDKQYYKGIGVCNQDSFCQKFRNPVYYVKERLRLSSQEDKPQKKRKSFKEQQA